MKINFCVFNHLKRGIHDQMWFVEALFRQKGFDYACTESLDPGAINLVLENFVPTDVALLRAFCEKWKKKVGLIMSEHIELEHGAILFNGTDLNHTEYIGNKMERFFSAFALQDFVFAFFTLGELPRLATLDKITPAHTPYHLPYPKIEATQRMQLRDSDLIFSGTLTTYRREVLAKLEARYKVATADIAQTDDERDSVYSRGNVAINIPQLPTWPWISPMRVLYGLRQGVPTVHYGTTDDTMFSRAVLEDTELDWAIGHPIEAWAAQMSGYRDLEASAHNPAFPLGLFQTWGEFEGLRA